MVCNEKCGSVFSCLTIVEIAKSVLETTNDMVCLICKSGRVCLITFNIAFQRY